MGTFGWGPFENDVALDTAGDIVPPVEEWVHRAARFIELSDEPLGVESYQTHRALIELLVGVYRVGYPVSDSAWLSSQYILDVMTRDRSLAPALHTVVRKRLAWLDKRVAETRASGWKPKGRKRKLPAWAKRR